MSHDFHATADYEKIKELSTLTADFLCRSGGGRKRSWCGLYRVRQRSSWACGWWGQSLSSVSVTRGRGQHRHGRGDDPGKWLPENGNVTEKQEARVSRDPGEVCLRHVAELRARGGKDIWVNVMRDGELPAGPVKPSVNMITRPVKRI